MIDGCPFEQIPPETWQILAAHNDWEKGHSPVSMGRAPWLPHVFTEGVLAVASAVQRCNASARARAARTRRLEEYGS